MAARRQTAAASSRNGRTDDPPSDTHHIPDDDGGPTPSGWWPHGGLVERLDDALTLPVAQLEIPAALHWLEGLLTAPGMWFGVPMCILGVGPLLVALVAELGPGGRCDSVSDLLTTPVAVAAFFPTLAAWAAFWWVIVRRSRRMTRSDFESKRIDGLVLGYQPTAARSSLVLGATIPPHVALLLTRAVASDAAHGAACLYVAQALVTLICMEATKASSQRPRPVWRLRHKLEKVKRHLPQNQHILRSPTTRNGSFPSGDVSGAAALAASAATASAAAAPMALLWVLIPLSSAFGRVFFHAHHVIDVTCGALLGLAVPLATRAVVSVANGVGEGNSIGVAHGTVLLVHLFFLVAYIALQRLKPKSARH